MRKPAKRRRGLRRYLLNAEDKLKYFAITALTQPNLSVNLRLMVLAVAADAHRRPVLIGPPPPSAIAQASITSRFEALSLIALCPSPRPTEILRGLAFSATGMRRLSTPSV